MLIGLPQLGFFSDDQATFERLITLPDGILLVTGPTGSGKTTTIYAALNHLNNENRCIITIEDPVEYELRGVSQMQVEPRFEMGFADAFKAILRQDPDVILLGEIRDADSAQTAVNASGAGHLVLSTLHTNDAAHAVPRLLAMDCDAHVLSNSLQLIVAQRLLRRLCPACRTPDPFAAERLAVFGSDERGTDADGFWTAKGCAACNHVGYLGRTGAFELLNPNEAIRELILAKAPGLHVYREARAAGMRSLHEDALRLAREGVTSLEEVARVTAR
jgi:type II secretory ATPase GspE/PulE/Tfp pilus assembly ATPase PilB-like protein